MQATAIIRALRPAATTAVVAGGLSLLAVLVPAFGGPPPRQSPEQDVAGAAMVTSRMEPALAAEPQSAPPGTSTPPAPMAEPRVNPSAGAGQAPSTGSGAAPSAGSGEAVQITLPAGQPALPPWATSVREAGLWSGPSGTDLLTRVPPGATFRVLEHQGERLRVFYPGDHATRLPGEAWVDVVDTSEVPWPRWVRLRQPGAIRTKPSADGATLISLKEGDFVEVVGEARGNWAHVFYLGDGRVPVADGWVEAGSVIPIANPAVPSRFALSRETLATSTPDTWLKVPYRSQLDGTPYASANCGPTTANMILESFGFRVPQANLRREVLGLQPDEDCDDCGTYIENLAEVIARRGLTIGKLRDDRPDRFHRWTQEEIRTELRNGRPVLAQVYFRRLPGRETSSYYGDHYILLIGLVADRFLYNDSIDSDGPGYSRLITPEALDAAMRESDFPYAAFSVGS